MTYFRIQTADRDPADLIDPDRGQVSYSWNGPECYDRPGVSVCTSLNGLATYLAQSGIPYGNGEWVIVELHGDPIPNADPMDGKIGEVLVYPTEIVAVQPMNDEFFDMIGAACDALGA